MAHPPIGVHAFVAGGLPRGLRYARALGAEAVQIFVSSPRSWGRSAGDPAADRVLREAGLPVYVHASYLVNVGSPDPLTRERSAASLRHALARGREIGARGVVVHTGSAAGSGRDAGLRQARECLLPVLESLPPGGPDLLLEPTAGRGELLCARAGDLEPYLDALGWHPRAGVCLDTCHAFAAGHDLTAPGGVPALLAELRAALHEDGPGPGRLRLVHANDAKDPCGSRRDRHENLGAGHLGAAPFAALLRDPAARQVPFIIETPGPGAAHARDLALLRGLRAGPPARPASGAPGRPASGPPRRAG